MKKILCTFLALTVCCAFFAACSGETEGNGEEKSGDITSADSGNAEIPERSLTPLMWRVSDSDGNVLWLFGSIHAGDASMTPLPAYVLDAYNASDALAVEADVLALLQDISSVLPAMQSLLYQDGTTISDHISEELYNRAKELLTAKGVYSSMLDLYKPVMWMSTLESFMYTDAGFDEQYGIDMQLLTLAHESGREIQEIESAAAQYDMLASFSDELQELLLESTLELYSTDDPVSELRALADAWCAGDIELLGSMISEDTSGYTESELELLSEYNKKMYDDRNSLMTGFAEASLKSGKQVFLCVGSAHMLGETGLVEALTARGYSVELVTEYAG